MTSLRDDPMKARRVEQHVPKHFGADGSGRLAIHRLIHALPAPESQHSAILDAIPAGVYICRSDGTIAAYNNRAAEIWRREPKIGDLHERFCGAFRLFLPDGSPLAHERTPMADALATGEAKHNLEVIVEREDGSRITVLVNISPLHDEHGRMIGAINCFQDITARKHDERLLQQNLEQRRVLYDLSAAVARAERADGVYEAALDGLRDALGADRASILLYDQSGTMRFRAWRGLSDGYRAAVEGHSPWSLGDQSPEPIFIDDVEQADLGPLREVVLAEGIRSLGFFPLLHKGRLLGKFMVYFDSRHRFSLDETQLATAIAEHVSIAIDRQRSHEALHRREQEFRALAEHTPDVVERLDREFRHLYMSPSIRAATGIEPSAFIGRTKREVGMPREHCERWERAYRRVFERGEPTELEYAFKTPAGEDRFYSTRLVPERNAAGAVDSVLAVSRDITSRRRGEEARSRLAAIVESSQDVIVSKALDGTILSWNRGAELTFGYAADEAIGKPITMIIPPHRRGEEERILAQISQGERVAPYETERVTKDGRIIDVSLAVSPVFDEHGRVVGASKIARDITERKMVEVRLRASEARLSLAMDAGRMGAWDWDIKNGTVRWSQGLEEIHGLKAGQFGGTFEDFARDIHPDDRDRVLEAVQRAVSERGPYRIDYRILAPNGRICWLEARGRVLLDDRGEPSRMTGVCMDITERKAVAEEARAQAAFRKAIEKSIAAGIVAVDLDGKHTYANRAFCEMTGFSAEELEGLSPPFPYWPREHIARIRASFEAMRRGEAPASGIELRYTRRDGVVFDALVIPSPLHGPDGEITGWLSAVTDITTQKRNEAELARHRDQLEGLVVERTMELESSYEQLRQTERMAALGTLSAGLGHDMGNLLLPLRLRLDAIERKVAGSSEPDEQEVRQDIEAIRKCAEYMQRLTNGLRLFALDPNDEQASEGMTDLYQWWSDVEPFLRNALPKKVELERELIDHLPPVRVARHLLTQAVFNLIQNAGDAMRQSAEQFSESRGSSYVRLIASMDESNNMLRLAVVDNGPGMTTEVRKRCLEPFYTTKPRGLSTGLGLALVHGIALRAGGRFEIDSALGQGTTMTLVLPAAERSVSASRNGERSTCSSQVADRALVSIAEQRMSTFATSVLRSLSVEACCSEDDSSEGAASYDMWVTDDIDEVNAHGPRLLSGGNLQRIVLVVNNADALLEHDRRIVTIDPAGGRPAVWRTLRSIVSEIRRQRDEKSSDSGRSMVIVTSSKRRT